MMTPQIVAVRKTEMKTVPLRTISLFNSYVGRTFNSIDATKLAMDQYAAIHGFKIIKLKGENRNGACI